MEVPVGKEFNVEISNPELSGNPHQTQGAKQTFSGSLQQLWSSFILL